MNNEPKFLTIYTDGACSGNPGAGGWAAILIYGEYEKRISGGEKHTTNNKMELLAAIQGLKMVTRNVKIKLYTDSTYVQKGITEWIIGWKKKNFKDVKNIELWKELDEVSSKFEIEWNWVKAHNGNKYNEIVDEMAREEAQKYK